MQARTRFRLVTSGIFLELAIFLIVMSLESAKANPVISDLEALKYFSQYGYLQPLNQRSEAMISEKVLSQAISDFQSFAGINITGNLDKETVDLMSLPRCGVKDIVRSERTKRYVLEGSRWLTKNITYKISKYPTTNRLSKSAVDHEIARAFSAWAAHTDLTFTRMYHGAVHINIAFLPNQHGDGDPFDGMGGTLAHAYFPRYSGDVHFDDDEYWTINSYEGTNLFQTAAHEFGHALGLKHSDAGKSLMAPFYRGFNGADITLDIDDIQAIQAIYGQKPVPPPVTVIPEKPKHCSVNKILTIFQSAKGHPYVFKGDYYWKLYMNEGKLMRSEPILIQKSWKQLPGNIDAAFTYIDGKTYFFKGSKYWVYKNKKIDGNYPQLISHKFSGIPDNIDAVISQSGDGSINFHKGNNLWVANPTKYSLFIPKFGKNSYFPKVNLKYHKQMYSIWGTTFSKFSDRFFIVNDGCDKIDTNVETNEV